MQPRIHWVYYFGRVLIRILAAPFFWWTTRGRKNLPKERPVIVACNHLHIADPPVMAAAIPFKCVFMAKEELWKNPWSRYWVENFGSFPVKRDAFDRDVIRMAEAWLNQGVSLIMFPEGARSKTSSMNKASPGAALLALRNNIPIVPVGITGTQYIRNLKWAFFHRPKITITIGKPIYPPPCDGKPTREQRNQFCDEIMYKIAELLPPSYRGIYDREKPIIEKAARTGFCFGVRRAIDTLEKVARERGGVETLGAVVHNQQVLQKLAKIGVKVVDSVDDIKSDTVVTSSHGVSPDLEDNIRAHHHEIISTTCANVSRAQQAAKQLAETGFFVIVYGDAKHPEVKGILGWAKGKGLATTDEKAVVALDPFPRKLGILSQTTQVPAHFENFVKKISSLALKKKSEINIIDTICPDLRERLPEALELAKRSDLMLVVGGRSSANTNRLAEICARVTETHLIETAAEINPAWTKGKKHIGVTSGASTDEQTVEEVMQKLRELDG